MFNKEDVIAFIIIPFMAWLSLTVILWVCCETMAPMYSPYYIPQTLLDNIQSQGVLVCDIVKTLGKLRLF